VMKYTLRTVWGCWMKNHFLQWLLFFGTLLGGVSLGLQGCAERTPSVLPPSGTRTVQDVLDRYGPGAEQRLVPSFHSAGVPYPPVALTFLGFKAEKRLEVWARQPGRLGVHSGL
jgi:hypothetical protein